MAYVTRNPDGSLALFANRQHAGQQFLEDNHPDVKASIKAVAEALAKQSALPTMAEVWELLKASGTVTDEALDALRTNKRS